MKLPRLVCPIRKFGRGLLRVLIAGSPLLLWELAAILHWVPSERIPPPHVFLHALFEPTTFRAGIATHDASTSAPVIIFMSILRSSYRVLGGVFAALAVALPVGLLLGRSKLMRNLAGPMLAVFAPLSPAAWAIFAILLLPTGDAAAIFVVFVSVLFLLIIATTNEVKNVDKAFLDLARSLGANPFQETLNVILPAALPGVLTVFRLNFFAGWMAVLIAEALGFEAKSGGLGSLIIRAKQNWDLAGVLAGMTLIAIVGVFFDQMLLLLQRRLSSWRKELVLGYD